MTDALLASDRPARNALVTGGAGFIGSHLAERLAVDGYGVTILDDLSTGRVDNVSRVLNYANVTLIDDSLSNEALLDRLVGECDVVFHLAAAVGVELIVRDPIRVFETNVLGTHAVLRAAIRHRKKTLITSTSEIYGKSQRTPFGEDDDRVLGPTTKSRWSYSTSKAMDEFLALAYHRQNNLPVIIARLFNTVGPRQSGQYGMVVPRLVQQALRGEPLTVYGDGLQSRCFCDVEDVTRALIGLAECPEAVGQVFNVGSTNEVSIVDLARKILILTNAGESVADENRITLVPYDRAYESGFEDTRRRIPDIRRIGEKIGWYPQVPLEETLRRVIAYCRDTQAASTRSASETPSLTGTFTVS